jgi:hypothetical protein
LRQRNSYLEQDFSSFAIAFQRKTWVFVSSCPGHRVRIKSGIHRIPRPLPNHTRPLTLHRAGWLRAGDYFSVNGELKRLTEDASTNGSGEATLTFEPFLRNSPVDNAVVTVTNPTCNMVLADDSQLSWQSDANRIYQERTFSAFEVFT